MYRPLARRVVKTQIQHVVQQDRSTLTKPAQLQLSQQPVCHDTPADALTGIGEHEGLVSVPTMISVPAMVCYSPAQSCVPPRSFVCLVGDHPVEQTVVDSQRRVAVTCAPQATVVRRSATAKKLKKLLSTKRQCSCC